MPEFTAILRGVSAEKFSEIFSASSRKAREAYYHRHDIRKPKVSNKISSLHGSGEARTKGLFDVLQGNDDDQLAEEVLRTWLLTKRPMLAMALDPLEVPHDNGLTEAEDIDDTFGNLTVEQTQALITTLSEKHAKEDVALYLRFMGAKTVDEALA